MWKNDGFSGFRVSECYASNLAELKAAIKTLLIDWPNVEAYAGNKKIASAYNYNKH